MINNYSVIDGIRVILGNYVMQLVGLIALCAMANYPAFKDSDEEESEKMFFWELFASHIFFLITNYLYVYHYNFAVQMNVLSTFWAIILMI